MTELGIYGGTFAPVHNGHVYAAHRFLALCSLDRLLLMPTRRPPHKEIDKGDDPRHRLNMLRLAFPEADQPESRLAISDFEIRSPAPSYTALTLEHFAAEDVSLTFFLGTDMFLSMDSWYHPETVFSLAAIAHIPRKHLTPSDEASIAALTAHYESAYSARIRHLPALPHPLSSTDVRMAIRRGASVRDLVPNAVADYIEKHRLYTEVVG